jgi:hypothetical protein
MFLTFCIGLTVLWAFPFGGMWQATLADRYWPVTFFAAFCHVAVTGMVVWLWILYFTA